MGGTSSTPRRVDAVLAAMSETVVKSQSTCLAAAENRVLIDVGGAQNFTMKDVRIKQVADASVQCVHNATIQVGSMHSDLKERLHQLIVSTEGAAATMIDKIALSVTEDVASRCIAQSINEYEILVGEAKGDVSVVDLDLEQVATAHLEKCLTSDSVKVGDIPLKQYLEEELPKHDLISDSDGAMACRETERLYVQAYGVAGGSGAVILLLIVAYWLWQRKRS